MASKFSAFDNKLTPVAVVDVEFDSRISIRIILESSTQFRCAGNYSSLDEADRGIPDSGVQVVLLGVRLLDAKGLEWLRRFKLQCPDTKVILLMTMKDAAAFNGLPTDGVDGFLVKPNRREECLLAIQYSLAGGFPMGGDLKRWLGQVGSAQTTYDPRLSKVENQILAELADGAYYKEVADRLNLSLASVKNHIHEILQRYQVSNKVEALRLWSRGGLATEA